MQEIPAAPSLNHGYEASPAVRGVYSVLVETGLSQTEIGKRLMASAFITDMGTALTLSVLFIKPTIYTLVFISASLNVIYFADEFSSRIFNSNQLRNKVIEPEIKYIFLLLFAFMYFANLGEGHAVLPAFILGLLMSKHFTEESGMKIVRNRLRTVAYAIITPIFFIVGCLRISLPMISPAIGLFIALFMLKMLTKFLGVYFIAKRCVPEGKMYMTLLMSTGLTFGTIASVFGLQAGFINQQQYSVLVGVLVASAIIPRSQPNHIVVYGLLLFYNRIGMRLPQPGHSGSEIRFRT